MCGPVHRLFSACVVALIAVWLSAAAFSQEREGEHPADPGPKRGWLPGWFGGEGGGAPDDAPEQRNAKLRQQERMMLARGSEPPVQMALSGGKLYVIVADTIRRLDAITLAEEATAEIPQAMDEEQQTRAQEAFLKRFDTNADGAVTEDELGRPELLRRLDRDGDGKITISEVPASRNPRAAQLSPATMLVEGGNVYVFRAGQLFRFKADDLKLEAKAQLGPAPGQGPLGRLGERRELIRRRQQEGDRPPGWRKRDRKEPPLPPPEAPEEPVRF